MQLRLTRTWLARGPRTYQATVAPSVDAWSRPAARRGRAREPRGGADAPAASTMAVATRRRRGTQAIGQEATSSVVDGDHRSSRRRRPRRASPRPASTRARPRPVPSPPMQTFGRGDRVFAHDAVQGTWRASSTGPTDACSPSWTPGPTASSPWCTTPAPSSRPIFHELTGVVCTGGTPRSHIGIVSREFQVPCIMACVLADELSATPGMVELGLLERDRCRACPCLPADRSHPQTRASVAWSVGRSVDGRRLAAAPNEPIALPQPDQPGS